jgi:hypothetical protein
MKNEKNDKLTPTKRGRGRPPKDKTKENQSPASKAISKIKKIASVKNHKDVNVDEKIDITIESNEKKINTDAKDLIKLPKDLSMLNSNQKLDNVIDLLNNTEDGVIIMEDGKRYTKVSERVKRIRQVFGFNLKIISIVKNLDALTAWVEAQIWIKEGNQWDLVQTANASEAKADSFYNQKSYLEIAETSAIGRALGFLGLFGSEFASVDEMNGVELKPNNKKNSNISKVVKTNKTKNLAKEYITESQIKEINEYIKANNYTSAEFLNDLSASTIEGMTKMEADEKIEIIRMNFNDEPM